MQEGVRTGWVPDPSPSTRWGNPGPHCPLSWPWGGRKPNAAPQCLAGYSGQRGHGHRQLRKFAGDGVWDGAGVPEEQLLFPALLSPTCDGQGESAAVPGGQGHAWSVIGARLLLRWLQDDGGPHGGRRDAG